jgi:iron complex transport system ATP-binding protein
MLLHHVDIAIQEKILIKNLHWHIQNNECWCIIARNGAGKSTLLRSLVGLHPISQGEIRLNNQPLSNYALADLAKIRSYLPQIYNDTFSHYVIDAILGARFIHHTNYWDNETDIEYAKNILHHVDAAHLIWRKLNSLSGGERQRVAIATLLTQDTPYLFLDEPLTALDLKHQIQLKNLLLQLHHNQNKTLVVITHDLYFAHEIATHILLLMPDGTWKTGTKEELLQETLLSDCLGHPIHRIQQEDKIFFIPAS